MSVQPCARLALPVRRTDDDGAHEEDPARWRVKPAASAEPKGPSRAVQKALFALSGNQCAYEGCPKSMVDQDGTVRGKICHIKGSKPGSARYAENQPAHERHGFYNLLVMCADHSDEIDGQNAAKYPTDLLMEWKRTIETRAGGQELDPATIKIEGPVGLSINQSGGITAGAVHIQLGAEAPEPTDDALQILHCAATHQTLDFFKLHTSSRGDEELCALGCLEIEGVTRPPLRARIRSAIASLEAAGLLESIGSDTWRITGEGYERARSLQFTPQGYFWLKPAPPSSGGSS